MPGGFTGPRFIGVKFGLQKSLVLEILGTRHSFGSYGFRCAGLKIRPDGKSDAPLVRDAYSLLRRGVLSNAIDLKIPNLI